MKSKLAVGVRYARQPAGTLTATRRSVTRSGRTLLVCRTARETSAADSRAATDGGLQLPAQVSRQLYMLPPARCVLGGRGGRAGCVDASRPEPR